MYDFATHTGGSIRSASLLTMLMPWGFGGKSKSGKGLPKPLQKKKDLKNTDYFDAHTQKKTDHSANGGKDIEVRVSEKKGHACLLTFNFFLMV